MKGMFNRVVRRVMGVGMTLVLLVASQVAVAQSATAVPTAARTGQQAVSAEEKPVAFVDIKGSYAEAAINRLAALRILNGSGEDVPRFYPGQPITRRDFAVLMTKAAGLQPNDQSVVPYDDVPTGSQAAVYVGTMVRAGLIQGRTDGRFGADQPLTRQDLAVILQRLLAIAGEGDQPDRQVAQYKDEERIADYARQAVYAVAAKGWMTGEYGLFQPYRYVTRADAAIVAERIVQDRIQKAEKYGFQLDRDKLVVVAGTSERIRVTGKDGASLPFSPVFGFDRPDLGQVLADGTFVAGPYPGSGQLTVSIGYNMLTLPVEITADGTPTGEEEDSAQTPPPLAEEDSAQTPPPSAEQNNPYPLINFATGSHISVKTTGPEDPDFRRLEKNYPGPVGGVVADSDAWTGYNRQFGREITLDLDGVKPIEQVRMTFLQDRKMGVFLPPRMEVEVSRDGKTWYYAGAATHNVPISDESSTVRTLTVTVPPTDARYVRVRFPVKVWVFARQLQVWGSAEPTDSSALVWFAPAKQGVTIADKKAGERMENLLLAYSGSYGERGEWKVDDFRPLVGYIDPQGRLADRMFDSILFLPYPNLPATKDDWLRYLNNLFQPGRQLDALNQAMMEYNKKRGSILESPTTENVVLTIPYPDPQQGYFGRLESNQDPLTFRAADVGEDRAFAYRKQAVEWYFQQLIERWNKANYRYLRLEGIYWFHELVDETAPKERQLIWETAEMVHEQALRFYWIPYYEAPGYTEWKSLGFDYAFVQPNFYGDKEIPVDRIEVTLAIANKYGMGIEVEGDERMVRDLRFYRTYYNQLIAGHKLGIDTNKVHAYYYGSKSLLEAFASKDAQGRAIYDDTYRWMRSRFSINEYLSPLVTP